MAGKDWFSLGLILIFLIACLQPFCGCLYRTARHQLWITILEILKAPFGKVRFRDFFFADVITSMGVPLVDIGLTVAYFKQGNWASRNPQVEKSKPLDLYVSIMMFLPFWWRFWQCINKWYL